MTEIIKQIAIIFASFFAGIFFAVWLTPDYPDEKDVRWIKELNKEKTQMLIHCEDKSTDWVQRPVCDHEKQKEKKQNEPNTK